MRRDLQGVGAEIVVLGVCRSTGLVMRNANLRKVARATFPLRRVP